MQICTRIRILLDAHFQSAILLISNNQSLRRSSRTLPNFLYTLIFLHYISAHFPDTGEADYHHLSAQKDKSFYGKPLQHV